MRNILLMKPGEGSAKVAQKLVQSGFPEGKILQWPAFLFKKPDETASLKRRLLHSAADGALIVIVSPSAVSCMAEFIDAWPQNTQFACVGHPTAAAVEKIFHPSKPVIYPQGTVLKSGSESLYELLKAQGLPKQVVICRGQTGREFLREALIADGTDVSVEVVYQRIELTTDKVQKTAFASTEDWLIYLTSTDSVDILRSNVPSGSEPKLRSARYVTIHPRIVERIRQSGAENVRLIDSEKDDVVQVLIELASESR